MMTLSCRAMLGNPVYGLTLGFGAGLSPRAPGTVGTLLGFPLYYLVMMPGIPWLVPVLLGILFVFGIWLCDTTARVLGEADHPAIVWDEIVAMAMVLTLTPDSLAWQVAAFAVFRFFDIVKPWPIRVVDSRMKHGFGVMLDDAIAAAFTVVVIQVMAR